MATNWAPSPDRYYHSNYYPAQHASQPHGHAHPAYQPYPQHHYPHQPYYPYNYQSFPPQSHTPGYPIYNNTQHGNTQPPPAQLNRRPSRASSKSVSSSNIRNKNNQKKKNKNSKKSKPLIDRIRDWLQNASCTAAAGEPVNVDAHLGNSHARSTSTKSNQHLIDNCSETNTQTQQTSSSSVISTISSLSDIVYDPTLATSVDNSQQHSNHPLPPMHHHMPIQQVPVSVDSEDILPYDPTIDYAALPPVETVAYIVGSSDDPDLPENIRQLFSADQQDHGQEPSLIPSSSSSLTNSQDEFDETNNCEEEGLEREEEEDQEEMKDNSPEIDHSNFVSHGENTNVFSLSSASIDFASYPNHDEEFSPPVTTTSLSLRHSSAVRNTTNHQHPAFFNNPLLHRTASPPSPVDSTSNIEIPSRRASIRNAQADLYRHAASENLLARRHSSVVNARNMQYNLNN